MGDEEKRAAVAAADLFTSTATRSRTRCWRLRRKNFTRAAWELHTRG